MKGILNKIKIFFSSLFQGMDSGDKVIFSSGEDTLDKTIGVHQVKDTQRVAQNLLKGEVTQAVKELRYRDYLVSESSRTYEVIGDEARKRKHAFDFSTVECKKIKAVNHMLYSGLDDKKPTHTLKIKYEDYPKFDLTTYCTQFYIDLTKNEISLYFDTTPNRNITTSKAFLKHLEKCVTSSVFGGEYNKIKKIWFVSWKISALRNYLKFEFENLDFINFINNEKEIILTFRFNSWKETDLIEKYKVEDLDKKYQNHERKNLPMEDSFKELSNCEICGKPIMKDEGNMHKMIYNKFCCSECYSKQMLEKMDEK